jgi:transporter family protein
VLGWMIPTLVYVLCLGVFGITGKLALQNLEWPDLILWSGLGYIVVVGVLLATGETELRIVTGTGWAVVSAGVAITALIALYLALGAGEAGKVTAISASYPVITLFLASVVLSEPASLVRWAGAGLVVGGVILLTLAP